MPCSPGRGDAVAGDGHGLTPTLPGSLLTRLFRRRIGGSGQLLSPQLGLEVADTEPTSRGPPVVRPCFRFSSPAAMAPGSLAAPHTGGRKTSWCSAPSCFPFLCANQGPKSDGEVWAPRAISIPTSPPPAAKDPRFPEPGLLCPPKALACSAHNLSSSLQISVILSFRDPSSSPTEHPPNTMVPPHSPEQRPPSH